MLDYINSVRFHDNDDAWSRNEHEKNYQTLVSILQHHEKLVQQSFDKESYSVEDAIILINDFYAEDNRKIVRKANATPSNHQPLSLCSCSQNVSQQVVEYIMEINQEFKLFKEELTAQDIIALLGGDIHRPLTSNNNSLLAYFFDQLASIGLIYANWQVHYARNRLILSSSGRRSLNQHDFSASLYRMKEHSQSMKEKALSAFIDKLNQILKED